MAAIESLEQRLDEISRNRSEDVVRLAGAGFFRVVHYKAYSGRDPERGLIVQVPAKARRQFEVDDALYELVNGRPCPPILKSDAAELDALAWQVLLAFEEYDVVKIPGIGSIRIELKRARPGATVDGDPIIVPERWVVRFRA